MHKEHAFKDGFIVIKDAIPLSLIEELKGCALSLLGYSEHVSIDLLASLEDLERSDSSKFYKFCTRLGQSVAATKIALLPQFVELISGVSGLQPFWLTDGAVFYNSREVTHAYNTIGILSNHIFLTLQKLLLSGIHGCIQFLSIMELCCMLRNPIGFNLKLKKK